jgi:hypothetical protein
MTSFTTWAAAALLAGGAVAATAAEPDPMAGFYGARLKIEITSGGDYRGVRTFSADHTFRDTFTDDGLAGSAVGRWTIEDGKICVRADAPGARKYCNPGLGKKVGDTWTDEDPYTHNPVRFTLEPAGSEPQEGGGVRR